MKMKFLCKLHIERDKKNRKENENSAVLVLAEGDFINGRHLVGLDPKVVSQERNRSDVIANVSEIRHNSVTISAAGKDIQLGGRDAGDKIVDDPALGRFKIRLLDVVTNNKYLEERSL